MQLAIIITQKVTCVTSHHLHFSMCSKCPPAAQTQAVDIDLTPFANSTFSNCMTQAAHASFQFVYLQF